MLTSIKNSMEFILHNTGKIEKSLSTFVNLKLNFEIEYSFSFWSPYVAFFEFLGKKFVIFLQFRSLPGAFENQFHVRFDDDIFFMKIEVAKKIKFRKKLKIFSNSASIIAVEIHFFHFFKILKWQFRFKKK